MGTATKNKDGVVDLALAEAAAIYEVAEQILWRIGLDEIPTAAQREILRRAGIDGMTQLEGERGRVEAVKQLLKLAGSRADYLAAERTALQAGKEYEEKAPALEAELVRIQSELDALNRARSDPAHKLEAFNTARCKLRAERMLPKFVWEAYDADRRAAISNARGRRIRELTNRLRLIDDLQNISPSSQEARLHCEAIDMIREPSQFERLGRGLLTRATSRGSVVVHFDHAAFCSYRERRLKGERPEVEAELNELRSQQAHAIGALDPQLDYYISKIQ